ncbi:hypothetical protein T08_6668 [Trichinella sp. T8]|nr:hypothetical protein T08_12809 [Trichinella sp. T8]KRZ82273.1 hypothetical protein T08_6668 [Trichinella sp. T8]
MLTRRRRRESETDKAQSDGRQTSADQDADPPAPPGGSLHREKIISSISIRKENHSTTGKNLIVIC